MFSFSRRRQTFVCLFVILISRNVQAEHLKPGFDPKEYYEMLLLNPFVHAKDILKKQKKVLVRCYTSSAYNKMDSRTKKATKTFKKYLGNTMEKVVKETLPQLQPPPYVLCNNYMEAGSPIILHPNEDYFRKFKYDGKNVFVNHFFAPYIYLTKEQFGVKE